MKRLLLMLVSLLLLMPRPTFAQGGELSSDDINRIVQSVVAIAAIKNNKVVWTGSGTIMTASGLIYTNRHVVMDEDTGENADDFAILMIYNISEKPALRYYAAPKFVSSDTNVDFATLQIDRDNNGDPVNADKLNLPTLTASTSNAFTGNTIYIFGFPSIGDGYLTLTKGIVSSVENQTVGGSRVPTFYRTDANISPGNSGGAALDSKGQFIGIPTAVKQETETGGRLGYVLSATAVTTVLNNPAAAQPTKPQPTKPTIRVTPGRAGPRPTPGWPTPNRPTIHVTPGGSNSNNQADPSMPQSLSVKIDSIDQNVADPDGVQSGLGMTVHTSVEIVGFKGKPVRVAVFFYWADDTPISGQRAPKDNQLDDGSLTVQTVVTPSYNDSVWHDFYFWLPYSFFPSGYHGAQDAYVRANIGDEAADTLNNPSPTMSFSLIYR